ncbi:MULTISPECIES: hypothetical protein [Paraburkholderia]|uniref:Uncharacterized protein n=2 Tax=Paraburkholderia TaxID=1822464 RepID=A0A7Y9WNQ9_9BURK|nr:hypothetical protein [Paraburkholderia bryophila]NYH24310.1 hypothetical protein [Paraburkholderia bryophila]
MDELDYREFSAEARGVLALGPARFRKIFTAGIVLAIFGVAILLPHVASHPGPHTTLRQ